METPPVEMQDFVQQLLADFADCYSSDRALEPLHDNAEYMRLTELRFLLKNVRELLDIQLYQAYSRSETISYDVVAGGVARAAASRSGSIDEGDGGSAPSPSKKAKKASEPGALTSAAESDAIFPSGSGGSAVNPLLKRTMTDRNYLLQRRSLLDAEGARLRDFIACRIELSNRVGARENSSPTKLPSTFSSITPTYMYACDTPDPPAAAYSAAVREVRFQSRRARVPSSHVCRPGNPNPNLTLALTLTQPYLSRGPQTPTS